MVVCIPKFECLKAQSELLIGCLIIMMLLDVIMKLSVCFTWCYLCFAYLSVCVFSVSCIFFLQLHVCVVCVSFIFCVDLVVVLIVIAVQMPLHYSMYRY